MTATHVYLSTACWHELNEGRPDLHGSCRSSCKFAAPGAPEYCACPNHTEDEQQDLPLAWVDQARDTTRALLAAIDRSGTNLAELDPDLHHAIVHAPEMFWARGEEAPPEEWQLPAQGAR